MTNQVLVAGSAGINHFYVRRTSNSPNDGSERLFLEWPARHSITYHDGEAGSPVLFKLLRAITKEPANKLVYSVKLLPPKEYSWQSVSKWFIRVDPEEPDKSDKTSRVSHLFLGKHIGTSPADKKTAGQVTRNNKEADYKGYIAKKLTEKDNFIAIFDHGRPKSVKPADVLEEWFSVTGADIEKTKKILGEDVTIILRTISAGQFDSLKIEDKDKDKETGEDKLWNKVLNNTILVSDIDELSWDGFAIETPVSWEQVFKDTAKYITKKLKYHEAYKAIVVFYKNEGACIYCNGQFTFHYYPGMIGNLTAQNGKYSIYDSMIVSQAAIVAALAQDNNKELEDTLDMGVLAGLNAKQRLLEKGFMIQECNSPDNISYPHKSAELKHEHPYAETAKAIQEVIGKDNIKAAQKENQSKRKDKKMSDCAKMPAFIKISEAEIINEFNTSEIYQAVDWQPNVSKSYVAKSIKKEQSSKFESILKRIVFGDNDNPLEFKNNFVLNPKNHVFKLCKQIVEAGHIKPCEDSDDPLFGGCQQHGIPFLAMGKFLTYDTDQIQQICETYNALKHYTRSQIKNTPFSVCVFGPPGAGKSFAVKAIARFLNDMNANNPNSEELSDPLTINLSQFTEPAQLARAFHSVRDQSLEGKLPLVFFDEFDCALNSKDFGWLRYFLAPMQDGEFWEDGQRHRLSRAIFVFAGSVAHTMEEFIDKVTPFNAGANSPSVNTNIKEQEPDKGMKGSDFISRVKGFIDIAGPNSASIYGVRHFFRRATLLRSALLESMKMTKGNIVVDDTVILAFLNEENYKHGARSLEAIIQMSGLEDGHEILPSSIYTGDRLKLYVTDNFKHRLTTMAE